MNDNKIESGNQGILNTSNTNQNNIYITQSAPQVASMEETGKTAQEKSAEINGKYQLYAALIAVMGSIIAAIIGAASIWGNNDIKSELSVISAQLSSQSAEIRLLQSKTDDIDELKADHRDLRRTVDDILKGAVFSQAITLRADGALFSVIKDDLLAGDKTGKELVTLSFEKDMIIATDSHNNTYTLEALQNKSFLIPYKEGDQDVFFYGGFDENGRWNGICLINVYYNDRLIVSTEALYESGNRTRYSQVFSEADEWIYSERQSAGDESRGITWKYERTNEFMNEIDGEEPSASELLRPADIIQRLKGKLTCIYHGNTSNGRFNDSSGHAYLISFDEVGAVKTLYYGQFKDGLFHDETRNAWYITRDPKKNTTYMYYRGVFRNGTASSIDSERVEVINPASKDYITEIISRYRIVDDIVWANVEA